MGGSICRRWGARLGAALVLLGANAAFAQGVPQPAPFTVNGETYTAVPIDPAASNDLGVGLFTAADVGLDALFASLGEPLDFQADAGAEPAVFLPLCSVHAELLLRGTGCRMDLGLYCVDDPTVFVPLLPNDDVLDYHAALTGEWAQYKNDDAAYVPLVGMPPVVSSVPAGLRAAGALLGCASERVGLTVRPTPGVGGEIPSVGEQPCAQQKYSEARLSPTYTANGEPWVSALMYPSPTRAGVVYAAFEDLPSSEAAFNPPVEVAGGSWAADGDFNDFVYRIEGLVCVGGGMRCDTGLPGRCAAGVTDCSRGGRPGPCRPWRAPAAEACNALDDDCNGRIDDGEGLCPSATPICAWGQCLARCGTGEFVCPPGYTCDPSTDRCVETACAGVDCGPGTVCRGGTCLDGCAAVTCPSGQACVEGQCVDPCSDVECPTDFVCETGACVPDCRCGGCPGAAQCEPDGRCVDAACAAVTCDPGLLCRDGACIDPCAGVVCPGGVDCHAGTCPEPGTGGTGGIVLLPVGGTGGIIVLPTGGIGGTGAGGVATTTGGAATITGGATTAGAENEGGAGPEPVVGGGVAGGAGSTLEPRGGLGGAAPGDAGGAVGVAGMDGVPEGSCEAGTQLECRCADGQQGAQRCRDDGTAWEDCVCAEREASKAHGGCGCRTAAPARRAGGAGWLALALLAALRRRRVPREGTPRRARRR